MGHSHAILKSPLNAKVSKEEKEDGKEGERREKKDKSTLEFTLRREAWIYTAHKGIRDIIHNSGKLGNWIGTNYAGTRKLVLWQIIKNMYNRDVNIDMNYA